MCCDIGAEEDFYIENKRTVHNEYSLMSGFWKTEKALVLVLLAVCLTLFFFRLGSIPLFDRDEGLHAVTSKEMVLSGDWITTKFNGQNFYDKPVFFDWLVALSFEVLGFTELAARLPAALLGLGCVIVTYLLGRKMYNPVTGFLGGMILATSPSLSSFPGQWFMTSPWFSLLAWLYFSFTSVLLARDTGNFTFRFFMPR